MGNPLSKKGLKSIVFWMWIIVLLIVGFSDSDHEYDPAHRSLSYYYKTPLDIPLYYGAKFLVWGLGKADVFVVFLIGIFFIFKK